MEGVLSPEGTRRGGRAGGKAMVFPCLDSGLALKYFVSASNSSV